MLVEFLSIAACTQRALDWIKVYKLALKQMLKKVL